MSAPSVLDSLTNFLEENSHREYYGRIMSFPNTITIDELEYITFSPDAIFPFVMGPDTIHHLKGKSINDMFEFIGYTKKDLQMKIEGEEKLVLVFFTGYSIPTEGDSQRVEPPLLATWDNVLTLIDRTNSICGERVRNVLPTIQTKPYESYEFDIDKLQSDIRSQVESFDSFANSSHTSPQMVRAFLRHTLKLKKLYSGDGYSYNERNEKGSKEYLIPRVRIKELINRSELFDLTDIVVSSIL